MSRFDRIQEFDPTLTYVADTSSTLGAPGIPGEIRFRVNPNGHQYGLQGFRLVKNETDGAMTVGLGYTLAASETTGTAAAAGGLWGAATTTPLNHMAGVAVVAAADNYWTWLQVYGVTIGGVDAADDIDAGDIVETAANGTINDTAGTGLPIGFALEAEAGEVPLDVFLTIVQPA